MPNIDLSDRCDGEGCHKNKRRPQPIRLRTPLSVACDSYMGLEDIFVFEKSQKHYPISMPMSIVQTMTEIYRARKARERGVWSFSPLSESNAEREAGHRMSACSVSRVDVCKVQEECRRQCD